MVRGYLRAIVRRVKWREHIPTRHARPCAGHPRLATCIKSWMAGTSPAMTQRAWLRMFTNRRTVRIESGDCDPAGIVVYPRYFAMFDHSTGPLLESPLGVDKPDPCQLPPLHG